MERENGTWLTDSEKQRREAEFWASKSMAERVIAGWELAERSLTQEERDELQKRTGWTLVRVPYRRLEASNDNRDVG